MASLRLTLFGKFRAYDSAGQPVKLVGTKPTLLLTCLALRAGNALTRDSLAALFWSDRGDPQARASLRQAIWGLRRALQSIEPFPIVNEGDAVYLDPVAAESDALKFESLLADSTPESLEAAMALYRGELLQGVHVRGSRPDDFLRAERQRFQELAIECGTQLLEHYMHRGSRDAAAATARRLIDIDPLQEFAHRALMECYAERGQIGLAQKQYQRCRDILRRELDVEPENDTQRAFERIRLARPCGSRPPKPAARAGGSADRAGDDPPTKTRAGASPAEEFVPLSFGQEQSGVDLRCPRCQCENRPDSTFCRECGEALNNVCSVCGAAMNARQKFCSKCGARTARAPPPLLDQYSAVSIGEMVAAPPELVGERKQVTVLFAEICDSVRLVAGCDPEEAGRVLDPILRIMMEAVHRYQGIVSRVFADGIVALFGAPIAHEDHALRACYAALHMQNSLRRTSQNLPRTTVEPQLRVGLNSGEVVLRVVQTNTAMEYDAIGATTLIAGRMRDLAQAGTICLAEATLRLAEGLVAVRPLDLEIITGSATRVATYYLEGATPIRSRFQATVARGLSRFVGRNRELNALGRALDDAEQGRGRLFAVVGEPGVGKSRLLHEFTHGRRTMDRLILETRCASYGKATPYHPFIDLLWGYFQVHPQDESPFVTHEIRTKLASLGTGLECATTPLLALLDVPADDFSWETMDAAERRRRTMDAIKRVLLAESRGKPVVIVVEDLQWADQETQACLDSLVDGLPAAQMLLLVSYRPEYRHSWGNKTYYEQRFLTPLPPESVRTLLDSLLGQDPLLSQLKQLLLDRAEGNPLCIEESVRTLLENGSLAGELGAVRLMDDIRRVEIPATVRDILAARLDRLAPEDKQLLQTASVIGKDVRFGLLMAVSRSSEDELLERLSVLRSAEFLYETSLFPDVEYTFKHALTHEVTYGSLLIERRQALHRRVMEAIEELYPARLAEHVDRLAFHAMQGEQWAKAAVFLQESGRKTAAHSAYHDAVSAFENALLALSSLPENDAVLRQAIDLRFELRSSLQALGDHQRVFEHLRQAENMASRLGDQNRLGWASAYLSQYLPWRRAAAEADSLGNRALKIASSTDDVALRVVATFFLGQAYYNLGQYHRATEFCRQNLAILPGDWLHERLGLTGLPSVLSRTWLAWSLAERGAFVNALHHAEDALVIAEAADQPYSIAAGCLAVGQVQLLRGKVDSAVVVLGRGLEICRVWNLRLIAPQISAALGLAEVWRGNIAEALSLLESADEDGKQVRIFDSPLATSAQAIGYLEAGRANDAVKVSLANLDQAIARGFRGSEAWAEYVVGLACTHQDRTEAAASEEHLRRGLALATELSMEPLAARCHVALTNICRDRGSKGEAEQHSAAASTMYSEMQGGQIPRLPAKR